MSAGKIPFLKEVAFNYGEAAQVTPLIRRVVARNPSPFTFHGTNTYIVGRGRVAVIDPGPDLPDHIENLVTALAGEEVGHILTTHTHRDHSPAARLLKQRMGGITAGAAQPLLAEDIEPGGMTESVERKFTPDLVLEDGEAVAGEDWTIAAVSTPGHMPNHLCFALAEETILFTGDHIMGWNTTVVSPPYGNMSAYLKSLERCIARDDAAYWPAHGPVIPDPGPFAQAYLDHRLMREDEIIGCLERGLGAIPAMVETMYQHVPRSMHQAAACSVLAHLEHLTGSGRVACDGPVNAKAIYRLA